MTRKFDAKELVIATHNKGKMQEFLAMMGPSAPKLSTSADFKLPSPAETGKTFVDNAKIKAFFVAEKTRKVALADDSGLCVDALNGDPGLYSADWAEKPDGTRDFEWAIEKVLEKMKDQTDRSAHFISVLVLAWPDGHFETVEGIIKGKLTEQPQGRHGHGFDPIFQPEGYDVTFAEMSPDEKNRISHRAVAFNKMMDLCFR